MEHVKVPTWKKTVNLEKIKEFCVDFHFMANVKVRRPYINRVGHGRGFGCNAFQLVYLGVGKKKS